MSQPITDPRAVAAPEEVEVVTFDDAMNRDIEAILARLQLCDAREKD